MVFPNSHLYVTFHWAVMSGEIEHGQFGLRFDTTADGTTLERDAIRTAAGTFWSAPTSYIASRFQLQAIKYAIIGTDGKYPPDFEPVIDDFPAPYNGGVSSRLYPLQVAHAMSLTTAAARGRAHRGRVYLPPMEVTLLANDTWSSTQVQERVNNFKTLLNAMNAQLDGPLSVFSRVGAGTKRTVTGLAGGSRPDVQRRRARQIPEVYSVATL